MATAGLLGGCSAYKPGGSLASDDQFTFISEPWAPTTIALVDTRTGQTHWTVEVPVGQQVVVRFIAGEEPDNIPLPDTMRWQLMAAGKESGQLRNAMNVPPTGARRMDVSLRRAPEMPVKPEPDQGPIVAEAGRPKVLPVPIDARPGRRAPAPAPAVETGPDPRPEPVPEAQPVAEPGVGLPPMREPAPSKPPARRQKVDVP
jgi:hypothetical protein